MVCELDKLAKNEKATIIGLSGSDSIQARLLELGLLPGTLISSLSRSVFGSPLTITCRGSKIALRPQAASHVLVEKSA
jgi:ferrous iron transport protein A